MSNSPPQKIPESTWRVHANPGATKIPPAPAQTADEVAATMKRIALYDNERRRYGYALTDKDRQWLVSIHNICTLTDCECGHYHIFESTP